MDEHDDVPPASWFDRGRCAGGLDFLTGVRAGGEAAGTGSPEVTQSCPGLVAANRPRIVPASFDVAALDADQVRITYIGHATFLIESPQLVRIATDYNDFVRPPVLPDIATMNHAHEHPLHR